jgi:hypothetical protein
VLAGILSAICLWFAWRAFRRCREIEASGPVVEADPVEARLAEQDLNLELNLSLRNVKALGRTALFGGAGVAFWVVATGQLQASPLALWGSFGLGLLGWAGCSEIHRRIGSLAESWRAATNRKRRRQGVDPSERTG